MLADDKSSSDTDVPVPVNFRTYQSAMGILGVSRRTLQRWMDDMLIEPLNFEGTKLMFLTRLHLARLEQYRRIMQSRDHVLIARFRIAIQQDEFEEADRLVKQLDIRSR